MKKLKRIFESENIRELRDSLDELLTGMEE